ncbi:MAG TPA: prepilin-type N-terminal cleavage/methylation domain-containing protein, partial [Nitrospirota bacterium]
MRTSREIRSGQGGFTLAEIMIAIVIFALVIGVAADFFLGQKNAMQKEEIKSEMQQSTRIAFDRMVREMMMMGYGAATDAKILTASPADLKFETYFDTPAKMYSIEYSLEGTRLKRTSQEVVAGTPPPPVVDYIVDNVNSLSFAYFGKKEVPVTDPTKKDDIRHIVVTLDIRSSKPVPGSKPPKYMNMVLKADLYPRNMSEGEAVLDSIPPDPVTGLKVRDTLRNKRLKVTWNKCLSDD